MGASRYAAGKAYPRYHENIESNPVRVVTPNEHAEAYRQAEASLRLEGLDPSGSEPYEALKAQVISGEVTAEDAKARTYEYFKSLAAESGPRAA